MKRYLLFIFLLLFFLFINSDIARCEEDRGIIKVSFTSGVYYSPDKKYFAEIGTTEGETHTLIVTNVKNKKKIKYDDVDTEGIVWAPDSSKLIFAVAGIYGDRPGIYLWRMKDNKIIKINPLSKYDDAGHMFELYGISKDGTIIYYYHYWDVITVDELRKKENFKKIDLKEIKIN
ncbi:MAG: hypothetical protein PHE84_10225 [bacterium]|nr:hypothetical protein [bacterium]